ncbi:hypothetical protein RDV64_14770 [Acuticoccus sp. MNP-M23]|nr:hypothetical protein [Acuticoccus sp. MNP-M23]WMS41339.1 hypothetical protein RDV64_14770 [Acuticoccus sp. MNP-M23]
MSDAGEYVAQIVLRVDAVEAGGLGARQDAGSALAAPVRSRE